jgi:hypothetical protein
MTMIVFAIRVHHQRGAVNDWKRLMLRRKKETAHYGPKNAGAISYCDWVSILVRMLWRPQTRRLEIARSKIERNSCGEGKGLYSSLSACASFIASCSCLGLSR